MANSEGITFDQARKLSLIWSFTDNWRQRFIEIYEHPTETKVVTIGYYQIAGPNGSPLVCVEAKSDYRRILENKLRSVD